MREDQIANGVNFLTHPKVQSTPMPERIAFLKNKGLSKDEVEEAVKRANKQLGQNDDGNSDSTTPATATSENQPVASEAVQQQPMQQQAMQQQPMQQQPMQQPTVIYQQVPATQPPPQPLWSRILVPATLALSAGAGLAMLYRTYILNEDKYQFIPPWMLPPPGPPGQMPMAPQQQQGQPMQETVNLPGAPGAPTSRLANVSLVSPNSYGTAPYGASDALVPSSSAVSGTLSSNGTSADMDKLVSVVEKQTSVLNELCMSLNKVVDQKQSSSDASTNDAGMLRQLLLSNQNQQGISDLKSELNTIKTLLLGRHIGSSNLNNLTDNQKNNEHLLQLLNQTGDTTVDTTVEEKEKEVNPLDALIKAASAPVKTEADKEEDKEGDKEEPDNTAIEQEKTQAARAALAKMCADDRNKEILVPGVNILLMYVKNLVKDPDVPRFRRIARTNSNYVKSLKVLEGHLDFLRAIGFEEKGHGTSVLEWSEAWRDAKDTWSLAVLKDAVANLESVKASNSSQQKPSTASDVVSAATPATASSKQAAQQLPATSTNPVVTATTAATATTAEEQPQSLSYEEVFKMFSEGKNPPGIKNIPDNLSADPETKPSMKAIPKPWEVAATPVSNGISSNGDDTYSPGLFGGDSDTGLPRQSFTDMLENASPIKTTPTIEEIED